MQFHLGKETRYITSGRDSLLTESLKVNLICQKGNKIRIWKIQACNACFSCNDEFGT